MVFQAVWEYLLDVNSSINKSTVISITTLIRTAVLNRQRTYLKIWMRAITSQRPNSPHSFPAPISRKTSTYSSTDSQFRSLCWERDWTQGAHRTRSQSTCKCHITTSRCDRTRLGLLVKADSHFFYIFFLLCKPVPKNTMFYSPQERHISALYAEYCRWTAPGGWRPSTLMEKTWQHMVGFSRDAKINCMKHKCKVLHDNYFVRLFK